MTAQLVAGLGFSSAATADEVIALIDLALCQVGRSASDLHLIATLDRKAAVPIATVVAAHYSAALSGLTGAQLASQSRHLAHPSERALAEVGLPAIAEAAALHFGPLVGERLKSMHATCALGHYDPEAPR